MEYLLVSLIAFTPILIMFGIKLACYAPKREPELVEYVHIDVESADFIVLPHKLSKSYMRMQGIEFLGKL